MTTTKTDEMYQRALAEVQIREEESQARDKTIDRLKSDLRAKQDEIQTMDARLAETKRAVATENLKNNGVQQKILEAEAGLKRNERARTIAQALKLDTSNAHVLADRLVKLDDVAFSDVLTSLAKVPAPIRAHATARKQGKRVVQDVAEYFAD